MGVPSDPLVERWPPQSAFRNFCHSIQFTDGKARRLGMAVCDDSGEARTGFLQAERAHFFVEFEERVPPRDDRIVGKLLDALAANGQRATMFFTGRYAVEFPHIVKRTVAEGHEIGSHSYSHAVLPELVNLKEFRTDLFKSISQLESIGGVKVRGYRAPKWSISDRSRDKVLGILVEHGLEYDSSPTSGTTQASFPPSMERRSSALSLTK
ncbi:MAG: polysaccharide deacetylase family protein [Bryobacteraceae bacterium]